MNGYLRLSLLTIPVGFSLIAACSERGRPLREWTPADHAHPAGAQETVAAEAQEAAAAEKAAPATAAEQEAADAPQPQQPGDVASGAALWNVMCARCHGRQGRGDGPARPPGASMPDMSDPNWQSAHSDQQLMRVIQSGQGAMAGVGERIDVAGLKPLIQHIRRLRRSVR